MVKQVKLLVVIVAMPLLAACNFWESSGDHIHNTNTGNVGIGITTPENKLSVNGLIESKSGGVKFPDGSVQTTAAAPMPRNLISVRKVEYTIAPAQLRQGTVSCQTDELVTGGGIRTEDDPKLNIWRNAPSDNAGGWVYGLSNYGSATRTVRVFAVCMRAR